MAELIFAFSAPVSLFFRFVLLFHLWVGRNCPEMGLGSFGDFFDF